MFVRAARVASVRQSTSSHNHNITTRRNAVPTQRRLSSGSKSVRLSSRLSTVIDQRPQQGRNMTANAPRSTVSGEAFRTKTVSWSKNATHQTQSRKLEKLPSLLITLSQFASESSTKSAQQNTTRQAKNEDAWEQDEFEHLGINKNIPEGEPTFEPALLNEKSLKSISKKKDADQILGGKQKKAGTENQAVVEPHKRRIPPNIQWEKVLSISVSGLTAVLGPIVLSATYLDVPTQTRLAQSIDSLFNPRFVFNNHELNLISHTIHQSVNESTSSSDNFLQIHKMDAEIINDRQEAKETVMEVYLAALIDLIHSLPADVTSGGLIVDTAKSPQFAFVEILQREFPNLVIQPETFVAADKPSVRVAGNASRAIAAKYRNDIMKELGDFVRHETGTGYLRDPTTREYLRWLFRSGRAEHPLFVRYYGWNKSILRDWRSMEQHRFKTQLDSYYDKYPKMKNGDPMRKTGVFSPLKELQFTLPY